VERNRILATGKAHQYHVGMKVEKIQLKTTNIARCPAITMVQ